MKKVVTDLQVKDLKVLVRVDFNVPHKGAEITDDNRIVAAIPTIAELVKKGAKVVLMSHLGKVAWKKLKKGEKLVNFSSEDTFSLCEKYKNGAESDRQRMMFTLQSLFNALVVIPSFDKGLIDSNNLTLSGDGSSLHIHASVFGHKVEVPDIEGDKIYRFSAPEADIGWDSDLTSYYLGYTFYNIAYHSPVYNCDLPVFISIEKASRHDALSCISTAAQFLDLNPDIRPKHFCHDSAADSTAIYQYFHSNSIIPVIDRNPRRKTDKQYDEKEHLNEDGVPVCVAGPDSSSVFP